MSQKLPKWKRSWLLILAILSGSSLLYYGQRSGRQAQPHVGHPLATIPTAASDANATDGLICPNCSCSAGSYLAVTDFSPPSLQVFTSDMAASSTLTSWQATQLARSLFHRIILDNLILPIFTSYDIAHRLMRIALSCPDQLFAFNLAGLRIALPTMYIYTRTGPGSRLGQLRGKYFGRHIQALHDYQALVAERGYIDGLAAESRQLLWIIVEDDASIDAGLLKIMQDSGINFLYFAHGPTNHYAMAQWNLVWKSIEIVRQVFGDGPTLSIDDDARNEPALYYRLWKLKRVMMWQVGNLQTGQGWWEGPVFEQGKLIAWTDSWKAGKRKYPVDVAGFSVNSNLVGTRLKGPQYIPADKMGQESKFLEQFISSADEIEPLCENTLEEGCHLSWHNSFFPEDGIRDDRYNPAGHDHP